MMRQAIKQRLGEGGIPLAEGKVTGNDQTALLIAGNASISYTARHTGIYLATFINWMSDNSPGAARTGRFLDGCLSMAENLGRFVFTGRSIEKSGGSEKAPQGT